MTGATLALRRVLPMLVWCVLVVIGILAVGWRGDQPGPVAARKLPLNTLLLKGDLVPDAFAGRYVVRPPDGVPAGLALHLRDVAEQPVMPSSLEVGAYISVPVAAEEIAYGVNAQATAQLCDKDRAHLATVQIVVVRCDRAPPAPGVDCFALARVPDTEATKLAGKAKAKPKELFLYHRCQL